MGLLVVFFVRLPNVAYHDKQDVHVRFPDKRTYLGSAAQIFHILKDKQKRVRMTLFELDADPAQALFEYFQGQGAKTVLVGTGGDGGHVAGFLRQWWDAAVASTHQDDFVMVVHGDSYSLAQAFWASAASAKPDLVFVDPFKIGDQNNQPETILASLSNGNVPFMCWTPLFSVPAQNGQQWPADKWSFQSDNNRVGDEKAQNFVDSCMRQNRQIAWLSWTGSNGASQKVYGCQLTFGYVLSGNFTTASIWQFANPNTLPYLDLMNRVANPGQQVPNFQNPATTSTCWPKGFFLKKVG